MNAVPDLHPDLHFPATRQGPGVTGSFVDDAGDSWYRIDHAEQAAPFFVALAGDSDLWAFISTAGSLAAGRCDVAGSFFPYETVDKIHTRWEHTGARTWVLIHGEPGRAPLLWQPFARQLDGSAGERSIWKNLSGTRLRLREVHPSGRLAFEQEWSSAAEFGLVRTARLQALQGASRVSVLDGLLNLQPPGVSVEHANTMSSLTDAYKWNESAADGRLGLFTLYAQIWDRAEPKESFLALSAWHAGLPAGTRSLLSASQVAAFCRSGQVDAETLTRGRKAAWLVQFEADLEAGENPEQRWQLVLDGPCSQVEAAELAAWLQAGHGTPAEIDAALARNTAGVDELLARADGLQTSGDPMAAAHHRANVLFNIMRGGVFVDGTRLERDDLLAFARQRHHALGEQLAALAAAWPEVIERDAALAAVQGQDQLERLVLEYLPLTFSRRHGDPSRPWNRFSIRVRDAAGKRVVHFEGNWRDIFQNWEALGASEPAYLGSMIATFLGAMTPDGYNPYRIGRQGIDWEVPEPDNAWSHIGYWGDHQVVYLLRLIQAAQAHDPGYLAREWARPLHSFADVPYRLRPFAQQLANAKDTIVFDDAAHQHAQARAAELGADGLRLCDAAGLPVLATLGEKLATLLLAKAGSLVPGGGLWLHTQRPEWNDANNALAGNGLSLVSLAHLRGLLALLQDSPAATAPFALTRATRDAVQALAKLAQETPAAAITDATARRTFVDAAGALLDPWRAQAYAGAAARQLVQAPADLLPTLARALLPLVDATLLANRREDGLFHSYNLVGFRPGQAEVAYLYPMLEGQVAMLGSGLLSAAESVALLEAMYASALYCPRRHSFMLYPDRRLPGFLERNRLDEAALALPVVQRLLQDGRTDLLQRQADGTVRFAPQLANRFDLETAGADLGEHLPVLVHTYERVLAHHAFTGRSGTMFGYEGLGCIYWHMVAKLLLAVQETVFRAADASAPELPALQALYRRVRDGLGYRRGAAAYGAFPADPYSHTPGEGGAQQPGMTGQVKEEILTRWGELGLRVAGGLVHFDPVLLDASELPLQFTWGQRPCSYRAGPVTRLRVQTADGWQDCPDRRFAPQGVLAVEAEVAAP